jgi:hypothetical protein
MVTLCASQTTTTTRTKTASLPPPMTDREIELLAILAAAELAFVQVCRTTEESAT